MRATACIVACSPPTASVFFWAAQARKLSLSASLEWEEEALQHNAWDSDGDAAIEVLSFLGRSLGSRRAWPIELVGKLCMRPP